MGIAPPRKVVRAAHDYTADDPLELSFREGDTIIVLAENASGWWKGEVRVLCPLLPRAVLGACAETAACS